MIIIVNKAPRMAILLNILSIFFHFINIYCEPTICLHFIEKNQFMSHFRQIQTTEQKRGFWNSGPGTWTNIWNMSDSSSILMSSFVPVQWASDGAGEGTILGIWGQDKICPGLCSSLRKADSRQPILLKIPFKVFPIMIPRYNRYCIYSRILHQETQTS